MANFQTLSSWHEKYVKLTFPKQIIVSKSLIFGKMDEDSTVYLNTRVMKHLYDKRTAVIYFLLLQNLEYLIFYPDKIYENGLDKRKSLIFVKQIKKELLVVVLEKNQEKRNKIFVITAFKTDEKYLEKFKLLWKRRAASPHRNFTKLFKV